MSGRFEIVLCKMLYLSGFKSTQHHQHGFEVIPLDLRDLNLFLNKYNEYTPFNTNVGLNKYLRKQERNQQQREALII